MKVISVMKSFRLLLSVGLSALVFPLTSALGASPASATSPSCIVSLSPTATATLYAIGAGAQVGAVDQDSNYPAAAQALATKDKINALSPSAEAIAGICPNKAKPSLVVISYNPSGFSAKLKALGITVLEQDAATSLDQVYAQITALGAATGHATAATSVVEKLRRSITASIAMTTSVSSKHLSVYYEVSTAPYYSLTSGTFIGAIMKQMGLVNIADAVATTADAGYPSLSSEYIVKANPGLILLAGDATPASVRARAGWTSVAAVKNNQVLELDPNVASQWGTRLGTLVSAIASAVVRAAK